MGQNLASRRQSLLALDSLNVFLADIQGGVGPFLVVYLTSSLHWNPAQVGLVIDISGLAGVIAHIMSGQLSIIPPSPPRQSCALAPLRACGEGLGVGFFYYG